MRNSECRVQYLFEAVVTILFVSLALMFLPAAGLSAEKSDFQFSKQPEIQQVKPQKPVKIKVHRTAKGDYSWELSGDNVDEIANADRRLRKLLKVE